MRGRGSSLGNVIYRDGKFLVLLGPQCSRGIAANDDSALEEPLRTQPADPCTVDAAQFRSGGSSVKAEGFTNRRWYGDCGQ